MDSRACRLRALPELSRTITSKRAGSSEPSSKIRASAASLVRLEGSTIEIFNASSPVESEGLAIGPATPRTSKVAAWRDANHDFGVNAVVDLESKRHRIKSKMRMVRSFGKVVIDGVHRTIPGPPGTIARLLHGNVFHHRVIDDAIAPDGHQGSIRAQLVQYVVACVIGIEQNHDTSVVGCDRAVRAQRRPALWTILQSSRCDWPSGEPELPVCCEDEFLYRCPPPCANAGRGQPRHLLVRRRTSPKGQEAKRSGSMIRHGRSPFR